VDNAFDVFTEVAVQSAFETVRDEVGSPKIMGNCAGIVGPTNTPVLDYSAADYKRVYRCEAPRLLLDDQLNPASCVEATLWPYSADGIHFRERRKSLQVRQKECPKSGVTINALAPAVVMTDLVQNCAPERLADMTSKIPMERCGTIEEVASMSWWIVSPECSFSTGFVFDLSGGRATYSASPKAGNAAGSRPQDSQL
jgi:2-dehydro-3-deoxy-L-rhamnonate dehydrogenase (NAD+)